MVAIARGPAGVADDVLGLGDGDHAVQFYEDDDALASVVAGYVTTGIAQGDACVLIVTAAHRRRFEAELAARGVDLASIGAVGRLTMLDAHATLAALMAGDQPDPDRFGSAIGPVLDRAVSCAPSGRVRAYGEMVDVLWAEGRQAAAITLEELWNQLARTHAFALLCGYAAARFPEANPTGLHAVCNQHNYVLPRPPEPDDARRELARLHRRVRVLELELARRDAIQRELSASEQELREFLDTAAVAIHWVGADGRIIWANRAELAMLGYTRAEYVGRHIAEFHADQDTICSILERLGRGESLHDQEARLRRKDGSIVHVQIDSNVLWQDGRFVHTRCFTRDVTQRKRAHDALAHLHQVTERLSAAITVEEVLDVLIGEGVSVTGASGGAVFLVDRATDTLEVLRSRGYAAAMVERHRRLPLSMRTPVTDCVRDAGPIFVECGAGPYDGEHADVYAIGSEARAAVPMIAMGRVLGALKLSFDAQHAFDEHERVFLDALARQGAQALDRARLFESERAARHAAEAADRRKDEFLAMLGHELRNPLAPIRTALEVMSLRGVGGDREREVIGRQVGYLSRLVDDLLDVSRITRGNIRLDRRPIEIAAIVAKAVELASPLLEQRNHELTIDVPSRGLLVDGDSVRLTQVICNLLTNAAKYTDPGGHVVVAAQRVRGEVIVRVADDGSGLDADLLPRVFDMFVQGGERGSDRQQGGLGLGLALARSLTELHGGRIRAASDGPGRGSEFTVVLPALEPQRASTPAHGAPAAARAPSLRILVVDDNADAAEMVALMLSLAGHVTAIAADGPSALKQAVDFAPDAAMLDIGLPVMDGYEVAARLRELVPGPLWLVALTGYGLEKDKARAREAGFDDHLVKPVSSEALAASLARAPALARHI